MFTVCPKCTLTLVVTTVDLRAGQGYVRCGRCSNVFNALIALREGEPGLTTNPERRRLLETAPEPSTQPGGSGVEMEPEPEPELEPEPQPELEPQPEPEPEPLPEPEPTPARTAAPEPEPELDLVFDSELPAAAGQSLEFDADSTDVSKIFIAPEETEHDTSSGTYEEVVLAEESTEPAAEEPTEPVLDEEMPPGYARTDSFAASEWSLLDDTPPDTDTDAESVIEESPLASVAAEEPHAPDPPWVQEMFAEAEAEAERARTAEIAALEGVDSEPETDVAPESEPEAELEVDEPAAVHAARANTGSAAPSDTVLAPLLDSPVKGRPRWQYASGIALLAVLLLLQVLHYNRQNLALNTTFGPAATAVYRWFGVTLMPRWDLTAYTVKQLGAEAEGSGSQLRVRLSVQNESSRVQPLPLLRLTLQDRYGNAVATRDLEPSDYLPKRVASQRLLEPDQRIDVELHVVDSNKAAIGFEIDACLKGEGGAIGCANEARRRAAG